MRFSAGRVVGWVGGGIEKSKFNANTFSWSWPIALPLIGLCTIVTKSSEEKVVYSQKASEQNVHR